MDAARKKPLLIGASVVLLAVAGFLIFTRGGAEAQYPTGFMAAGVDLETKEDTTLKVKLGDRAPWPGKSGKRTVYPWYFCRACSYRFVPSLVPGPDGVPRIPMMPSCTHCGAAEIVELDPNDETHKNPAGTAELPQLPQ